MGRLVVNGAIGLVFALIAALAVVPVIAAFVEPGGEGPGWLYWVAVAVIAVLTALAPTVRRAFGRGFLFLGAAFIASPLAMMVMAGSLTTQAANAGEAFGALAAGTIVTGAAAFIGFILGGICLIAGLVLSLGGRREVTIVDLPRGNGLGRRDPPPFR